MPVGTYLHLHAVGADNLVVVPSLARWGAKRGKSSCDPLEQQMSGSHVRRVLEIILYYPHSNIKISRSVRPICFFAIGYSSHTVLLGGWGHVSENYLLARRV
jgi:hypothetical protein